MNMIQQTWEELGFKVECPGKRVFVRTEALPEKIGSIYLPPQKTTFYGEKLGSKQTVQATVLEVGSEVEEDIKPGDVILFNRLVFASNQKMSDNTLTGWVNEKDIDFIVEEL